MPTLLPGTVRSAAHRNLDAEFADVWCALPKVVFSRTLDSVQGNAQLAKGSVAEEVAAALAATDKDVEIGGAGLAALRESEPRSLDYATTSPKHR